MKTKRSLIESWDKVNMRVEYIESLYKGGALSDLIENENKVQNDNRGEFDFKGGIRESIKGPDSK